MLKCLSKNIISLHDTQDLGVPIFRLVYFYIDNNNVYLSQYHHGGVAQMVERSLSM